MNKLNSDLNISLISFIVNLTRIELLNNNNIFKQRYFWEEYCGFDLGHTTQANVTINIENLLTHEFSEIFGIKESELKEKVNEGI